MIILNLAYPEKSDIKFTISKFPDGQQQIQIDEASLITLENRVVEDGEEIQIKSRMNNFLDLEIIICARRALRSHGYLGCVSLYVPYFLGSRSDRHFGGCSTNYLRDVVCPIINSLNFRTVTVLDPHSDVLQALIPNLKIITNLELVTDACLKIRSGCVRNSLGKSLTKYAVLVSPDAGSLKKVQFIAALLGYEGDIIICSKKRDAEGKLSHTIVPRLPNDKDAIIIDDICDGGNTFINIVKEITSHNCRKFLIVTHGIFSKGFSELAKYFDGVYTTNSYSDIENLVGGIYTKNFKQLNVF